MPSYPEIQAAVPPDGGGQVGKTLLRNAITKRTAYVLGEAESLGDLTCVDPETGAAIGVVIHKGRLFWYDALDTTTSDDGITCLVSEDGRRYKLGDGFDVFAYSVLSKSLSAPPVSPSIGDAYLVAAAATGDWAGKSNFVAVWTERGPDWEFINYGIGRLIYVEDADAYYHRNAGGTWVSGFGNLVIGSNSVRLSAAINFGKRVIVENITTTSPPGTAAVGVAYLIGPSATGAWSGQDGKIAICEVANQFTIYNPANGWLAYDKNTSTEYRYNGAAWISASGSWVDGKSVKTASGSTSGPSGATGYAYSSTTAPTTTTRQLKDGALLNYAAKKAGARLRFHYSADYVVGNTTAGAGAPTNDICIALFRDSVGNALDWQQIHGVKGIIDIKVGDLTPFSLKGHADHWFEISAPDASAHDYFVSIISAVGAGTNYDASSLTRRTFTVEEAA